MFILPKNLAAASDLPATCFFCHFLKPHWSDGVVVVVGGAVNNRGMRRSNSKVFELMRGPEHRSFKLRHRNSQLRRRPFFWTSSPTRTHVQKPKVHTSKVGAMSGSFSSAQSNSKTKRQFHGQRSRVAPLVSLQRAREGVCFFSGF